MRPGAAIGIGKTTFGEFPDRDLRSLSVEAIGKCVQNAGAKPSQVEAFYLGNFAGPSFMGQNDLAANAASAAGSQGLPATCSEAACASSGSAFFHAVSSVGAGLYEFVLAAGVEKMTCQPTPKVAEILTTTTVLRTKRATEGAAGELPNEGTCDLDAECLCLVPSRQVTVFHAWSGNENASSFTETG